MADTFMLLANGIPLTAVNTSMLALFNGVGSGKVLRVYRVWVTNTNQDVAITGARALIGLNRITAATASNWTVPPIPYNTAAAAVPAQVTSGAKFTVTTTDLFRRMAWSTEEPVLTSALVESQQLKKELMTLWDVGFADANVEPIVCREGFGVSVQNIGHSATAPANAGYLDLFIEFTMV